LDEEDYFIRDEMINRELSEIPEEAKDCIGDREYW